MPRPVILAMDGATELLTEAGMSFCVVEVKMVASEEVELIFGETQFPGDITPVDRESVVVFDDEGHGMVVK